MSITMRRATPEDAEGLARVHIQTWQETYRGIMPNEYLDNLSSEFQTRAEKWREGLSDPHNPGTTILAERDQKILGFCNCGPDRGDSGNGEFRAINIINDGKRQGIGTQFMQLMARDLTDQGFTSGLLWVAEGNTPAIKFYKKLGGQQKGTKTELRFGPPLEEVGFFWHDLKQLLP